MWVGQDRWKLKLEVYEGLLAFYGQVSRDLDDFLFGRVPGVKFAPPGSLAEVKYGLCSTEPVKRVACNIASRGGSGSRG